MSEWVFIGIVAYISFSLGIIAGCMIMTKDDREDKLPVNKDMVEKKLPESVTQKEKAESIPQEVSK